MSIVENMFSTREAAELIGITDGRLRQMIRAFFERCPSGRGKPEANECKALKVESSMFPQGHAWQVPAEEIERLKSTPRSGGRPRVGD